MTDEEKEANLKKYGSIYPDAILLNSNSWFLDDYKPPKAKINDDVTAIVVGIRWLLTIAIVVLALTLAGSLLIL